MDDVLQHYGVKGMKWGIRRTAEQLGHVVRKVGSSASTAIKTASANSKAKSAAKKEAARQKSVRKKKISELTDAELEERIKRLELERKCSELSKNQISLGTKFLNEAGGVGANILKNSAQNIGTQTATYILGNAINSQLKKYYTGDSQPINPKKGQKDK